MAPRFQLARTFTFASLLAISAVAITLLYSNNRQFRVFEAVQQSNAAAVHALQGDFVRRADDVARRDMIAISEQGHVNLARLFSNALWRSALGPYMDKAATVDFAPCRALPDILDPQGRVVQGLAKRNCFSKGGVLLTQLPGFDQVDRLVRDTMHGSNLYKIKVFDLAGTTIYATDATQIGEDKSGTQGWRTASREGRPVSELTFRGSFSAAHGDVEDRDLVLSYLPVREPDGDRIVGVVELYADVTPFLDRIQSTEAEFRQVAWDNEQRLAAQADVNRAMVVNTSRNQAIVVVGLLVVLYLVLLAVVHRAQDIIERQAADSDAARQRVAHADKMTLLGQMVAGVAHQLNTPLAFCKNNVQLSIRALEDLRDAVQRRVKRIDSGDVPDELPAALRELAEARHMLGDTLMGMGQMNELVDHLRSFSRVDRAMSPDVDLNTTLGTVCYIARTVIAPRIELVQRFEGLPRITCNVSQLNQVFLNLIVNAAQAITGAGTITVSTGVEGDHLCVTVHDTGCGIQPDALPHIFEAHFTTKPAGEGTGLGLSIARDIVRDHGGDIEVRSEVGVGTEFRVRLPLRVEGVA